MKTFAEAGLAEPILRAVNEQGYSAPTPIQSEVIPVMRAGRDVLGIAQTGTGKTAAFVLPLLSALAQDRKKPEPHTCRALILAPTRELASQIAESVRNYGEFIGPSLAVIFGGVKHGPQLRALAKGLDIVIATPGRLEDHLGTGGLRLDATTTVVLDEADQMLDLGFAPAIRRIMGKVPKPRQVVLLSATMPVQIRKLAKEFLQDPAEISVAPVSRPIEKIDQSVRYLNSSAKRAALEEVFTESAVERAIVFTRTKRGADRVSGYLEKAGLASAAIHGNKSQRQRERALDAFKSGSITILVATDIAARGIDIDGVSHVVNYELPNVPEAYVHRIGRTARAGKSGVAVSLCDSTELPYLRDIERLIGRRIPSGDGDFGEDALSFDPLEKPAQLTRHKRPQKGRRRPSARKDGAGGQGESKGAGERRKPRPAKAAAAERGRGEQKQPQNAGERGERKTAGNGPAEQRRGGKPRSGQKPRGNTGSKGAVRGAARGRGGADAARSRRPKP
ncbi:DEAD/DEAH box helicase [Polycladidibacter hongkongensis]|uniref:DEAD/DEAH box helicase n=1 Tax=Polycladidibacter hongkongensis TaxID=1647556 RepID=UPI000834940D|nr:DEAD/DEAH box helicase [Pseudovibrio hongkongensis]